MRKIVEYETLNDFWLDLKPRLTNDLIAPDSSNRFREFKASSKNRALITKLTVNDIGLATLKVSERINRARGYYVTELALISEGVLKDDTYRIIGNLAMSGYPFAEKKRLRVVTPYDIPESHQQVIDSGLQLIEADLVDIILINSTVVNPGTVET
jgi:hypothetical protein